MDDVELTPSTTPTRPHCSSSALKRPTRLNADRHFTAAGRAPSAFTPSSPAWLPVTSLSSRPTLSQPSRFASEHRNPDQALRLESVGRCDRSLPRSPRSPAPPRRPPALRPRHHREVPPAGDQPAAGPALQQGLLSRPGDRRAHPLPRPGPPPAHAPDPHRRTPEGAPYAARSRRKASRRDHLRGGRPPPRRRPDPRPRLRPPRGARHPRRPHLPRRHRRPTIRSPSPKRRCRIQITDLRFLYTDL